MITNHCTGTIATPAAVAGKSLIGLGLRVSSPVDVLRAIWRTLLRWQRRHDDRLRLATMDDRLLRDIGLSRPQAEAEARKPFWRA